MAKKKKAHSPIFLEGRQEELLRIRACVRANRNVLLEGPVGVGKTHLALAVTQELGRPVFRVDGDSRYSEQKLAGWFDPPAVIRKGYGEGSFVPGPLVEAMRSGGVLFINELNRLPEGVQNILLPAIDERMISVPRLGTVTASPGFTVVATQNPKEFVATSHLSEAILDRFEWVTVDYQSEAEEFRIVQHKLKSSGLKAPEEILWAAVKLVRATRVHRKFRRGASVRAAIAIAELAVALATGEKLGWDASFLKAVLIALPTRVEIERDGESEALEKQEFQNLLRELAEAALSDGKAAVNGASSVSEKKKS